MTDQTPTTEDDLTLTIEDVRYRYAYESRYQEVLESDLAEFDDWLAAHDREVAAKALYDARDDWRKGGWAGTPHHHDRGRDRIAAAQYAGNWLNDRADRIGPGMSERAAVTITGADGPPPARRPLPAAGVNIETGEVHRFNPETGKDEKTGEKRW